MSIEKNISGFIASISREAEEKKQKIIEETNRIIENQLTDAENSALRESYEYIKRETAKIDSDFGRAYSEKSSELYNQVLVKRKEIVEKVFNEVKEKLVQFTKSVDYHVFLAKSLKNVIKELGADCTIFVKEDDIAKISAFNSNLLVKTENIEIGGIIGKSNDGKIICDDTLDSRLNAQKPLFYKNSDLIIKD